MSGFNFGKADPKAGRKNDLKNFEAGEYTVEISHITFGPTYKAKKGACFIHYVAVDGPGHIGERNAIYIAPGSKVPDHLSPEEAENGDLWRLLQNYLAICGQRPEDDGVFNPAADGSKVNAFLAAVSNRAKDDASKGPLSGRKARLIVTAKYPFQQLVPLDGQPVLDWRSFVGGQAPAAAPPPPAAEAHKLPEGWTVNPNAPAYAYRHVNGQVEQKLVSELTA